MLSKVFDLCKGKLLIPIVIKCFVCIIVFFLLLDIKFVVGVISTFMIILSAFRYEVILDEGNDDYEQQPISDNVTTIDKKVLDALSKFDRNVSLDHL